MDIIAHKGNDYKKGVINGGEYNDNKNIFGDDRRNLANKISSSNVLKSIEALSVKASVNLIR